ncbi:MAG: hypothetical protein ACTSWQ_06675 [Candidatus Thorarchaeota archaeon]
MEQEQLLEDKEVHEIATMNQKELLEELEGTLDFYKQEEGSLNWAHDPDTYINLDLRYSVAHSNFEGCCICGMRPRHWVRTKFQTLYFCEEHNHWEWMEELIKMTGTEIGEYDSTDDTLDKR